jgi:hypothetical protein
VDQGVCCAESDSSDIKQTGGDRVYGRDDGRCRWCLERDEAILRPRSGRIGLDRVGSQRKAKLVDDCNEAGCGDVVIGEGSMSEAGGMSGGRSRIGS